MLSPFRAFTDAHIRLRFQQPGIGGSLAFILGIAFGVFGGHDVAWATLGCTFLLLALIPRIPCRIGLVYLSVLCLAAWYGAKVHDANALSRERLTAAQLSGEPIALTATVANDCFTIARKRAAPFAFFTLEEVAFADGTPLSGFNLQGFYYDADGPLPQTAERWQFYARIRSNAWYNTMQCSLYGAPHPDKLPQQRSDLKPPHTDALTGEALLARLEQLAETGETIPLIVTIERPPEIIARKRGGDYAKYTFTHAWLADGPPITHPKLTLNIYDKSGNFPRIGETWRLPVTLHARSDLEAITFSCKVEAPSFPASHHLAEEDRHHAMRYRFTQFRNRLAENLALGIAPEDALLTQTMTLGVRKKLPREEMQRYADAGIIHIFSISGLHVGILAGLLIWLLAWVGIRLRTRALLILPTLFGYLLLTGIPPSAARACLMASIYCVAPCFYRKSDAPTALLLTAVIALLYEPNWITNVGALLSFIVMGGILLYMAPIAYFLNMLFRSRLRTPAIGEVRLRAPWHFRLRRAIAMTLALTVAAWLTSLPLTLYFFGRVSIIGILLNLFIPPLTLLIVWFACTSALLGFIIPSLAILFNRANALLLQLIETLCDMTLLYPWAVYEKHTPPTFTLTVISELLLLFGGLYLRILEKETRRRDPHDPHAYALLAARDDTC